MFAGILRIENADIPPIAVKTTLSNAKKCWRVDSVKTADANYHILKYAVICSTEDIVEEGMHVGSPTPQNVETISTISRTISRITTLHRTISRTTIILIIIGITTTK